MKKNKLFEKIQGIGCLTIFVIWVILFILRFQLAPGKSWEATFVKIVVIVYWSGIILAVITSIMNYKPKVKVSKKSQAKTNAEIEKRKRIERIENMSEGEFISFVKHNRNELNKHFKNGGVSGLGHGNESMRWESSKYVIISTSDTKNFNEFIKIYRKTDNEKIFSGCWGYDFDY